MQTKKTKEANAKHDEHTVHRSNLKKKLRKGLYLPVQVANKNPYLTSAVEFCRTIRFTALCIASSPMHVLEDVSSF